MTTRFRPPRRRIDLILRCLSPLSHHDAARQDDSNRTLFNRQDRLLRRALAPTLPTQAEIDATCERNPVPADIAELFGDMSFPEFVTAAVVRSWIDLYNSQDGTGLFSTEARYERLEARLRQSAVQAQSLRGLWDRLCASMQVPIHPGDADLDIMRICAAPLSVQQLALKACEDHFRSIVTLARLWHATAKRQSESYAKRANVAQANAESCVLAFDAARITTGNEAAQVLAIPAVSGNSLRHVLVRAPAWEHLCAALELDPAAPGRGPVPLGVEALFVNGGNLAKGAKEPPNSGELAQEIRARYPSLDLLGGNLDTFDLGESRLTVNAWVVGRENRDALVGTMAASLPEADLSILDMLSDETETRQATRHGVGQMIRTFEVLQPGALVYVSLRLRPWTPRLTGGALWCALDGAREASEIGGQAARGFGAVAMEIAGDVARWEQAGADYEEYLAATRDALRDGLVTGTMGTKAALLAT